MLVKPEYWEKVIAKATTLEPSLVILNGGKTGKASSTCTEHAGFARASLCLSLSCLCCLSASLAGALLLTSGPASLSHTCCLLRLQASSRYDPAEEEEQNASKYSQAELLEAAKQVHTWLSTEKCPFRAFLRIVSAGGLFYQGQMSDKVLRSWLHDEGGKATLAHLQDSVLARHKPKDWDKARGIPSSSGARNLDKPGGLFD